MVFSSLAWLCWWELAKGMRKGVCVCEAQFWPCRAAVLSQSRQLTWLLTKVVVGDVNIAILLLQLDIRVWVDTHFLSRLGDMVTV